MTNVKTLAMALLTGGAMVGPAFAVSVINQDRREHVLTIDRGAEELDRKIGAGETVKIDCSDRCSVRVRGSGYDKAPDGHDRLIINARGLLQYVDEVTETGSTSASPGQHKLQKNNDGYQPGRAPD